MSDNIPSSIMLGASSHEDKPKTESVDSTYWRVVVSFPYLPRRPELNVSGGVLTRIVVDVGSSQLILHLGRRSYPITVVQRQQGTGTLSIFTLVRVCYRFKIPREGEREQDRPSSPVACRWVLGIGNDRR
jgi:hypothetical protein